MNTSDKLLDSKTEVIPHHQKVSNFETKDKITSQEYSSQNLSTQKGKFLKFINSTTLRTRLFFAVFPTVFVPLAVASIVGINSTQNQAKQNTLNNIEKSVLLTSEASKNFIDNALNTSSLLESNPLVINTLTAMSQKAQSENLSEKSIEEIEKQFAQTKLLESNPALNQHLTTLAGNQGLAEIILTESNGYNVAYSSETSDFVQSDEQWWQTAKNQGQTILKPEFDESTQSAVIELVDSITAPNSNRVLGVTKIGLSIDDLNQAINSLVGIELSETETIQIIDTDSLKALNTVTKEGGESLGELIGGDVVVEAINAFKKTFTDDGVNVQETIDDLQGKLKVSEIKLKPSKIDPNQNVLSFSFEDRFFEMLQIPGTELVVVASVSEKEIAGAGRNLINKLIWIALLLTVTATAVIYVVAKQISKPLTNLSNKAQQVADGNFTTQAELEGTTETITLAYNFNNLLEKVNTLINEQKLINEEQKKAKETLEYEIYQMLEEVEGALDGDLTVRASLTSMEMSTVADLFNAIIENLNDIAIKVKTSSTQVSSSLLKNQKSIQQLSMQAMKEADETSKTLNSVEEMAKSIENVAQNAKKAEALVDNAYTETRKGTNAMDRTVDSIVNLRKTVGETVDKMKHLEESSENISQVVSLIEEIALKTNLLAINAARSGEQGQGFSIFGEQLSALAEQSASATTEIAQILGNIQLETKEVTQAMEQGNSQVINSTKLVEATKRRLESVLERSKNINELMQSISQSALSQTDTSRVVTQLMQQISQESEKQLISSTQMAKSMEVTAKVAQELNSAVKQFKVQDS